MKRINYCFRHILACLHFNENIKRDPKKTKEGYTYYHVTYPKFKLGDEVVREVPVIPTYGKCYLTDKNNHYNLYFIILLTKLHCAVSRLCYRDRKASIFNTNSNAG